MILCVDTISSVAGVALVDGGGSAFLHIDPMRSSEGILGVIDDVMGQAGAIVSEITGVIVLKGPGSFTGLRVGISVANQFAHQLNVPIIGLRAEQWWSHATDEEDFVYLQSMNRSEVYAVGVGSYKNRLKGVIPLDEVKGPLQWVGQLSEQHRADLPLSFEKVQVKRPPQETWARVASSIELKKGVDYDLVEPFYGKDAKITKSKKAI